MSKDKQRLIEYLTHMLQAIERITRYTEELDEVAFLQNELVQDAVIRNFEILGEASNSIRKHYPEFATLHPDLPLAFAYQLRNAVGHGWESHLRTHVFSLPVERDGDSALSIAFCL